MPVSKETLDLMRTVRTSDIADALDSLGHQQRYEMAPEMRPLVSGTRFCGIAHTEEYDVIDKPIEAMSYDEFDRRQYLKNPDGTKHRDALWGGAGPWGAKDQVYVLDAKRQRAGILGSNNTLEGLTRGVVGYVIDGACRDAGECILQKAPVFQTVRTPAHPAGRIGPVSSGKPITCAGVEVRPGDIVAADEDGVMVVPAEIADEVASRAARIQAKDRKMRRAYYEQLGMPLDATVETDD